MTERSLQQLLNQLNSSDLSQRHKAIFELGQLGNLQATEALIQSMQNSGLKETCLLLVALTEIAVRSLKPLQRSLTAAITAEDTGIRQSAISELTYLYEKVTEIIKHVESVADNHSEDKEVRKTATWALAQLNRIRRTRTQEEPDGD
ncbi:MAG: hypothetical protein AAF171_27590 [Cyanobacteria bacterium P01_A01_bin.116]